MSNQDVKMVYSRWWTVLNRTLFLAALLLAIISLLFLRSFNVADAPILLMSASITVCWILALFLFPPVFRHLPESKYTIASVLPIATIVLLIAAIAQNAGAYDATPEGKKHLAARATADAAQAAADKVTEDAEAAQDADKAKTEQQLNQLKDLEVQNDAINSKLKGCYGTFSGTIKELRDQVQNSLNDPSSFDLVSTEIDRTPNHNVVMTFRTKNQFNATVLASVAAEVNPDTCAVEAVEPPKVDGN